MQDVSGVAVPLRVIGRYALFGEIASGGMATVHLGKMIGPAGFTRVVAMKRMHPSFAKDPQFVTMFLDEARLAARIRHPNVVSSIDVVAEEGELLIVMDYIEGESLARLLRLTRERAQRAPVEVAASILVQALHGLHAAHEAKSETGMPLGIVHRDVSPQNILVGGDGVARVVDFGIARAAGRSQETKTGVLKGKVSYMAPEQARSQPIDRRLDVYAASVVFWEALTGDRLFSDEDPLKVISAILGRGVHRRPSEINPVVPKGLDDVVLRGAAHAARDRYPTALDLADAIEAAVPIASPRAVAKWVSSIAGADLARRARMLGATERSDDTAAPPVVVASLPPPASGEETAEVPAPSSGPAPEDTRSIPGRELLAPVAPPALGAAQPEARRARAVPWVLVVAMVVLALGLALFVVSRTEKSAGAARASFDPAPPTRATSAPADAAEARAVEPIHPASADAADVVAPRASASSAPASRPRAPAPARCDPPHYYEDGLKKYKPGCLRR